MNEQWEKRIVVATRAWIDTVVIGLNLCPFASREIARNSVRFVVTDADTEQALLEQLAAELHILENDLQVETTLLIHPNVLQCFPDYNQFLHLADAQLVNLGFEGSYQIASFHPDYQFAGTAVHDAENYSNRSPFPMLHLLNETSLETALKSYPAAEQIPQRNIRLLQGMGRDKIEALRQACFSAAEAS